MNQSKSRERELSKNSYSKQILRQIICENKQPTFSTDKTFDLEKLKMSQAVTFLQKKIDKQSVEISVITQELSREYHCRQQTNKMLQTEKEKNQKLQQINSTLAKNLTEMKRKNAKVEEEKTEISLKRNQFQLKLNKMRDMLRKKQERIQQLQGKTIENSEVDKKYKNQSEEVKALRQSLLKVKIQEERLETEIKSKDDKISNLMEGLRQRQQMCIVLEESNRRLQDQCTELQGLYNQEQIEVKLLQDRIQQLVYAKETQIDSLKSQTQRFRMAFEASEIQKKEPSVYLNQIVRILKDHLKDKTLRSVIQQKIKEIVVQMDKGWNRILLSIITNR